jgi:acyl-CoA reductase-like NAD-dependent aldehyde dehydrogenase
MLVFMSQYTMTIDGQPVSSPGTLKVINPATGEVFAEVPDAAREQLDVAMESAQRAFQGWKDDYEQRRAVMHACADALEANAAELGRLATMEQGMPLAAGVAGVHGSARNFRWYADLDIPPFAGMKWSGLGSEMGLWSIYAYTDPQTVFRTRSQVIKKGAGEAPGAW